MYERQESGRCPHCGKPAQDGTPTTTLDVIERGYGRSPSGHTYFTEVEGKKIWHTSCLEDFNAQNERLRRKIQLDQDVRLYRAALGALSSEQIVAAMREAGRAEDDIAAMLKAVEVA